MQEEDGAALFSIDRTLQQFPDWRTPFVGSGATPAASAFADVLWRGRVWDLDSIHRDIGRKLIDPVRKQLSLQ
jgi:hypothetical protein